MKLLKFIWFKIKNPLKDLILIILGLLLFFSFFCLPSTNYFYKIVVFMLEWGLKIFLFTFTLFVIIGIIVTIICKIGDLIEEYKNFKNEEENDKWIEK